MPEDKDKPDQGPTSPPSKDGDEEEKPRIVRDKLNPKELPYPPRDQFRDVGDAPPGQYPGPRHKACSWCGEMTEGPHKGMRLPMRQDERGQLHWQHAAIDEAGTLYTGEDLEARGYDPAFHNISGGICEHCGKRSDDHIAQWRELADQRTLAQRKDELKRKRKRSKPEEPTA